MAGDGDCAATGSRPWVNSSGSPTCSIDPRTLRPTVATVGDDLTVKTLSQSGDVPIYSAALSPMWLAALGPTGVVILSSDGLDLWLGVPAAS